MKLNDFPQEALIPNSRQSLTNALIAKDYSHAFRKIIAKTKQICEQIEQLQNYFFQLGSKQDSINKSWKMNTLILNTADLFTEIFALLSEIKHFDYSTKTEKINNITQAKKFEDQCNYYKQTFEELTQKIKRQNLHLIQRSKHSLHFSVSSLSFEMNTSDSNDSRNKYHWCKNGKEYIDNDIKVKREQNHSIDLAAFKINSVSKKDLVNQLLKESKPGMHRRMESIEINQKRLESKVYKAFFPPNKGYCSKRLVYVILTIVVFAVFVASQVLKD